MRAKNLIFIALIFLSFDVLACRCPTGEFESIEYGFKNSEWVFVGVYQKEEFDKDNNLRLGYFDISKKIKGDFNGFSNIIRPVISRLSCNTEIIVGEEYVVFVPDNLFIANCNLTRRLVSESKNENYVYTNKTVKALEKLAK